MINWTSVQRMAVQGTPGEQAAATHLISKRQARMATALRRMRKVSSAYDGAIWGSASGTLIDIRA